ncbi:MAG: hypothetical protein Q8R90_12310 [Bacteroidales bacterium]|nr:hypothetical protein [Bacteroidales bacterium]
MKVFICSLLFSLFVITNLYSQHPSIKVNGLELGQAYTDSQIRDSLGNPTSVLTGSDDDIPGVTTYLYNNNWFTFQNGVLILFVIKTSQFKLNNILTVGMNFNVTSQIGGILTPFDSRTYCWYPHENYRTQVGCVTIQYNTLDNSIISIVGETPGFIL